jgi:hypothetical protein
MWNFSNFPSANAHIRVDGGFGVGSLQSEYWFHFNDLTTSDSNTAPVPEPGTIALLGLGMAGLAIYGKRRKNSKA